VTQHYTPDLKARSNAQALLRFPGSHWCPPQEFRFQSGQSQYIERCCIHFREEWNESIFNSFGKNPIIKLEGNPFFAELAILRLLEGDGFEGVWVSAYGGGKFHRSMEGFVKEMSKNEEKNLNETERVLPPFLRRIYAKIVESKGNCKGCWDVLARKGDTYLFVEAKQNSRSFKDQVRHSQAAWLEAALDSGISESSFVVAEWICDKKNALAKDHSHN